MKTKSVLGVLAVVAISFAVGFRSGAIRSTDPITSSASNHVQAAVMITSAPVSKPTAKPKPTATPKKNEYVLNTNTKKFHKPSCSSVKQMKDKNKKVVSWSRDEIIDAGYDPCGRCHP